MRHGKEGFRRAPQEKTAEALATGPRETTRHPCKSHVFPGKSNLMPNNLTTETISFFCDLQTFFVRQNTIRTMANVGNRELF